MLKQILPLPGFALLPIIGFAQTADKPLIETLDQHFEVMDKKPHSSAVPVYFQSVWKESGEWHAQIIRIMSNSLHSDFGCTDSLAKKKTGLYRAYHENGTCSDSIIYGIGVKNGASIGWHANGELARKAMYVNDMPVDTCLYWDTLGNLIKISITASFGNGKVQEMYSSGKVKAIGRLMHGEKSGRWIYKREDGNKLMDIVFLADTVFSKKCFDGNGVETDKYCYFYRPAQLSNSGFSSSGPISQELAQVLRDGGGGTVNLELLISSTGKVKDIKVLSSTHTLLTQHVEDMMRGSGPWLPCIELGQPVDSWIKHTTTFR